MQEFGDSAEYITSALAQQEELERATTPRELMESVSKGLWSVMMLESDGIQISSALHTLLESVRKEIVTMHTDFCIPLHYKHWWEQAKQEFASEIVELEAIHQTFKAHPCSDETEFQSLLAAIALANSSLAISL